MARREEGGYPQRSPTDEQQSQRALCAKFNHHELLVQCGQFSNPLTNRQRVCLSILAPNRPPANFPGCA
jgi:hypothetical protein